MAAAVEAAAAAAAVTVAVVAAVAAAAAGMGRASMQVARDKVAKGAAGMGVVTGVETAEVGWAAVPAQPPTPVPAVVPSRG